MQAILSLPPIRDSRFLVGTSRGPGSCCGSFPRPPLHTSTLLRSALSLTAATAHPAQLLSPHFAVLLSSLPGASLSREAVTERKRDRSSPALLGSYFEVSFHCSHIQPLASYIELCIQEAWETHVCYILKIRKGTYSVYFQCPYF